MIAFLLNTTLTISLPKSSKKIQNIGKGSDKLHKTDSGSGVWDLKSSLHLSFQRQDSLIY